MSSSISLPVRVRTLAQLACLVVSASGGQRCCRTYLINISAVVVCVACVVKRDEQTR